MGSQTKKLTTNSQLKVKRKTIKIVYAKVAKNICWFYLIINIIQKQVSIFMMLLMAPQTLIEILPLR